MKVLGIVGSMRTGRITETLVRRVIDEMVNVDPSMTSELVHTRDLTCHPCRVVCHEANCSSRLFQCSIDDDAMVVLERMKTADAVVIGAPHCFRGPPAGFSNEQSPLLDKPCGLIGVCEYSNSQAILEYLHDFCTLLGMHPVRLRSFPYLGVGAHGEIEEDQIFRPLERATELASALVAGASNR